MVCARGHSFATSSIFCIISSKSESFFSNGFLGSKECPPWNGWSCCCPAPVGLDIQTYKCREYLQGDIMDVVIMGTILFPEVFFLCFILLVQFPLQSCEIDRKLQD
jgi:hypothetical protein